MKAYRNLKYLAFAGAISLWGCSNQQYAQNSEYDDLYFSSQDKKAVTYTASTSSKNYADVEDKGVVSEDYSQKNVNPEYVQQYADQSRSNPNTDGDDSYSADDDAYYDEDYNRNSVNLARNYNRRNSGSNINIFPSYGFNNFYGGYGGSAFYDPFYDPYMYGRGYYDPFFARPYYRMRPGLSIGLGFGMGFGWGNSWGWNDPFYYGNRGYDPFYSPYGYNGWGNPYSGYGYGNPYRYNYGGGNVIVVPGNNTDRRTVQYGPRNGRGTNGNVSSDFNNSPRSSSQGGRAGNTNPDANTNSGGRTGNNAVTNSDSPRSIRPRGNTQDSYYNPSNSGRVGSNSNVGAAGSGSSAPRAIRPRGNDITPSNRSNRNYDYYNNSNRSNSPSSNNNYSYPRQQNNTISPRSNNNWNNNNSRSGSDFNRSSGGNSGGSFSSPRSSGGSSSGGSSSPRSVSPRSPR